MYAATHVRNMMRFYNILSVLDVSRFFMSSLHFEDEFNDFFSDFNIVIQFLFHTRSFQLTRPELFELLRSYERGIPFSTLYKGLDIHVTIIELIQTCIKMDSHVSFSFALGPLARMIKRFLDTEFDLIERLYVIVEKRLIFIPLSDDEKRIVASTRTASVENILEKYDEFFEQVPKIEFLPVSYK